MKVWGVTFLRIEWFDGAPIAPSAKLDPELTVFCDPDGQLRSGRLQKSRGRSKIRPLLIQDLVILRYRALSGSVGFATIGGHRLELGLAVD